MSRYSGHSCGVPSPLGGLCSHCRAGVVRAANESICFRRIYSFEIYSFERKSAAEKNESRTIIFYESVYRIVDLIDLLNEQFGSHRWATIALELTKTFETIYTAQLSELKKWIVEDPNQQKGEFVIIVKDAIEKITEINEENQRLLTVLLEELPLTQAVSLAAKITHFPRKKLYSFGLIIQQARQRPRY